MNVEVAPTPVLFGEDARRFRERMNNVKPISSEEKAKMLAVLEDFRKIATFPLPKFKE